jgi:hypothetical protein
MASNEDRRRFLVGDSCQRAQAASGAISAGVLTAEGESITAGVDESDFKLEYLLATEAESAPAEDGCQLFSLADDRNLRVLVSPIGRLGVLFFVFDPTTSTSRVQAAARGIRGELAERLASSGGPSSGGAASGGAPPAGAAAEVSDVAFTSAFPPSLEAIRGGSPTMRCPREPAT